MNKNFDDINSCDIESAIAAAGDRFTVSQVADSLKSGKDKESLIRRVERFIASDEAFFHDEKWNCCTRSSFFNGKKFLITPDQWEISNKILFPGHRFTPYLPESVFPSSAILDHRGTAAAAKKLTVPLGVSFHYHILLGSEQIFDFIIADDPANESLKNSAGKNDPVTLTVFDMAEFYQENDFLAGDALLCTVVDHDAGKVSFEYLSGSNRGSGARKDYFKTMDAAAERVWDEFHDYPDIPEQLAWMIFYASENLSDIPGASLDEFIANTEKVQLLPEGDHAVLTIASEQDDLDTAAELPDGLSISSGDLADPMQLLNNAGAALNHCELDGFLLDAIYGRISDFEEVRGRIFGSSALELPDEAQQAVLLNFLEERFETLAENYNRADDEPKAELRSQIMEAVSRRMEYLAMLGASESDPDEAEQAKIRKLADAAAKLTEALKLLNNPAFIPDMQEKENLEILIDDQIAMQEDILSDYSTEADQ